MVILIVLEAGLLARSSPEGPKPSNHFHLLVWTRGVALASFMHLPARPPVQEGGTVGGEVLFAPRARQPGSFGRARPSELGRAFEFAGTRRLHLQTSASDVGGSATPLAGICK